MNKKLIRKMLTAAGGPLRIKFTPEEIALFESQATRVPGMNNSGGNRYRKEGVLALLYLKQEAKRKEEEIKSRMEMRPTLKRRATFSEKLRGKKDEYVPTTQIVGMSGADPLLSFYVGGVGLNGIGALAKTGLWNIAKYAPTTLLGNWGKGYFIGNTFKSSFNGNIPKSVIAPLIRTRVGDVEIDNPNLLYHLDRGDGTGAFSNQGAYVENGFLFPGVAKKEGLLGYSWWNKGKPYATSIKGQPMTRLITTAKDTPGMLQVRSQNYPIGQWTGSKGFVLPSEYVNSEGVNVSGSIYNWKPGYGYKKITQEPRTSLAFFERKPSKSVTKEYVQSPKDITSDVGDLIAEGSERSVYASKSNPNIVYKIEDGNAPLEDINNIKIRSEINDDIIAPETTIGYYKHKNGKYYRVTQQDKYKSYDPDNFYEEVSPELNLEIIKTLEKAGWKVNIEDGHATTASKNGITIGNLEHFNWGRDSKGNLKLIDLYVTERKPSKISEAEKVGVPKGERNNVNNSGNLERTVNDIILENEHWLPKETGMFAQKHSSVGSSYRKIFEELWGKENTDRLTDDLLGKLILIRNHLIDTNIPLKGDFVYVVDGQAKAYRNGLEIGYLSNSYINNGKALHPEMVKKQGTNNAGVSELLYNGTILAENRPIISGSRLLMPEVTTHIWTKYPTRKLISTEGVHAWPLRTAQERGIKLNYEKNWHTLPEFSKLHQLALDENIRTNLIGLPIYELSEPSYLPMVKNARVFDISLLRDGYINLDFTPGFAYKQGGKMNILEFLKGGNKMKKPKKYVATSTGRTWNTREEAIKDNANYKKDVHYRYSIKSGKYKSPYVNYTIPFIKDKAITLSNAGLATGAVLSTNLLDSIAVNAERAGLPLKTALGLAVKESTLNNPTYDPVSRAKLSRIDRHELNKARWRLKQIGVVEPIKPIQNIGVGDTPESLLINYNPDDNPYSSATSYIMKKAKTWEDNLRMMQETENYADKQAARNKAQPSKSYLQAGFEAYKRNPKGYNPGQPNYPQLVDKRGDEVWGSPEIQAWWKSRSLKHK